MGEPVDAKEVGTQPSMALWLWAGIFLSPLAAAVQLQTVWLTSEYGCFTNDFRWNHIASVAALVVSVIGIAIAVLEYRKWKYADDSSAGDAASRRRFMALIGLMSSTLFTLVVIGIWLPTLMGVPCGK